ncbi:MAG: DedA family protein [Candidatus Diapherotrites archaeon]|nr:DedA family protein [Candidatus Diapherotrites archaeon]
MVLVEWLAGSVTAFISAIGYPGIVLLMALESMITPIPSELVMPFAGFLVAGGKMGFWAAVLAGALGSLIGSWISYAMGYWMGRPFVLRFGKFLLLNDHHLEKTEKWFSAHGSKTIFLGRLIPVVRHLISIPAGIGKMNPITFSAYTFAGAFLWCTILTYAGTILQQNWKMIAGYSQFIDWAIFFILAGGIIFFIQRNRSRHHPNKA